MNADLRDDLLPRMPPQGGAGIRLEWWPLSNRNGGRFQIGMPGRFALESAIDTKHPAIRETLRGIGRKHGTPSRRAAALTAAEIRKLSRACGTTLAGARDRALFLIGFAGALRRSELVGLDMEHLTWTPEGLTLRIERSKTDAEGKGAEINIPRGRAEETCPVTALQAWLTAAEITGRSPLPQGQSRRPRRNGPAEHRCGPPDPAQARRRGWPQRHDRRAGQPARPARRLRDDRLPQRRAGRGDHGPHAASQPDHHAQLRPPRQARPKEARRARSGCDSNRKQYGFRQLGGRRNVRIWHCSDNGRRDGLRLKQAVSAGCWSIPAFQAAYG